jgi:hypothetical protein
MKSPFLVASVMRSRSQGTVYDIAARILTKYLPLRLVVQNQEFGGRQAQQQHLRSGPEGLDVQGSLITTNTSSDPDEVFVSGIGASLRLSDPEATSKPGTSRDSGELSVLQEPLQ